MIFDGRNGGTVELLENVLVIRRKGVASFLTQGLKGEKRIPYSSIRSVQFKEAGFTTGYIQFGIAGGIESGRGVWDATTDENTVLFTKEAAEDFRSLRDIVEERSAGTRSAHLTSASNTQPSNVAEELTRLADLRDRGVLTEEEFAEQKSRLLGKTAGMASHHQSHSQEARPASLTSNLRSRENILSGSSNEKRKGGFGKALGIGCLAILGILLALSALGSQVEQINTAGETSEQNDVVSNTDQSPNPEPMKVSALQLARAYDANEARAQGIYGDQPLLVSATVAGVDLDLSDDPVLHLATDNEFMPASAYLVEDEKPRASALSKGQKISLLCQNVSEVMSMPQLKDCAIQ